MYLYRICGAGDDAKQSSEADSAALENSIGQQGKLSMYNLISLMALN